jgi:hypothetical protein
MGEQFFDDLAKGLDDGTCAKMNPPNIRFLVQRPCLNQKRSLKAIFGAKPL